MKNRSAHGLLRTGLLGALLTAALCVPSGGVLAQGSPSQTVELAWRPASGVVSGYKVHVAPAGGAYGEPTDLGAVAPGADGVARHRIGGLDPAQAFEVALSAYGPGGESPRSVAFEVPAVTCAVSCDDRNPCTRDFCDAGTCRSEDLTGQVCDDGNPRTLGDMCQAGTCTGALAQCLNDAECGGEGTCSAMRCEAGQCVAGQALSCEGAQLARYRLRWRPASGAVIGYRAYVGAASRSYAEPIELGLPAAGRDGVLQATLEGFDTSRDAYVALTAVGQGGESAYSAEFSLAATRCAQGCERAAGVCQAFRCEGGVCGYVPDDGAVCDDGNSATVGDRCRQGVCVGDRPEPRCENDSHCWDGDLCNGSERCVAGACVAPTSALRCDSAGPCQSASCNAELGCQSTSLADGTSCRVSGMEGMCVAGECAVISAGEEDDADGEADPEQDETSQDEDGEQRCSRVGPPRTQRLSWRVDPAHSMTFHWDAPLRDVSRLRIRPSRAALRDDLELDLESDDAEWIEGDSGGWSEIQVAPVEVFGCEAYYALEIGGLLPETRYEYAIEHVSESGPEWTAMKRFSTAAEAGEPSRRFRTAFVGATGSAGEREADRMVGALRAVRPDLLLGGGGYAAQRASGDPRPSAAERFESWLEQWLPVSSRAPFLPVYGEPERSAAPGDSALAYFRGRHAGIESAAAAASSRSFDVGSVHYVAFHAPNARYIDPATPEGARELEWLESDLTGARARNADFAVVYTYLPLYSAHPDHALAGSLRDAFAARLERHGVDLVLSGAGSGFERTVPVRAGQGASPARRRVLRGNDGVVYLRVGSAGAPQGVAPGSLGAEWLAASDPASPAYVTLDQLRGRRLRVTVRSPDPRNPRGRRLDWFVLR